MGAGHGSLPKENPMNSLNKICMSALFLGAAAIATPAMAQAAADQAEAQATAPATSTQSSGNAGMQSPSGDRAMTHDMDVKAASNAHVDSAGDTSKKYVRRNRASDFAKEQSITQQLNQQASAAASPTT
jgi:hypothetical protein